MTCRCDVAAFLLALVCATDLYGQRVDIPPYRARVLGVFDEATGAPVDSVRVTDVLNGNSSLTTRTGTVALYFLPDGGALVRLQKLGYEMQTFPVAISPADTTPITIMMRRVTELKPVVTKAQENEYLSPALRGFEERRRAGNGGYFVSDSVLRANEGRPLTNVLVSRMPNIKFAEGQASAMFLLRSARCVEGGPPQVYVDGVPVNPDLRPDAPGMAGYKAPQKTIFGQPIPGTENTPHPETIAIDVGKYNVTDLAGAEWYPDSDVMPIEFGHPSGRCGALLLWTRER
jgi:hypothetical protein